MGCELTYQGLCLRGTVEPTMEEDESFLRGNSHNDDDNTNMMCLYRCFFEGIPDLAENTRSGGDKPDLTGRFFEGIPKL
jgi:hypothetical protein